MVSDRPRFGFYAETCFHRTEHFLHDQLRGIQGADVRVLARWGAHLDEFPVPSLFLAEEHRRPLLRLRNALTRRIHRAEPGTGFLPHYVARRLRDDLRRRRVDLAYSLFGWNAGQLLDVLDPSTRLVYLAGGSDVTSAAALGPNYLRRLRETFDRASLILCGSQFLLGKLRALGAPADKVRVHYIGIELPDEANARARHNGPGTRFLAVSRLSAVKGVPFTIRAFARLAEVRPHATLTIIGEGEQHAECDALVERFGLQGRVRFEGSQSLSYVFSQMRRADVFVQHNVRTERGQEESLGGSILEAAAHRLPVVVSRSGGVGEAVADGRTGFLIDPGDESGMARAMLALADDETLREDMGRAGRAFIRERFDLREQNQRLNTLLHRVAEARP